MMKLQMKLTAVSIALILVATAPGFEAYQAFAQNTPRLNEMETLPNEFVPAVDAGSVINRGKIGSGDLFRGTASAADLYTEMARPISREAKPRSLAFSFADEHRPAASRLPVGAVGRYLLQGAAAAERGGVLAPTRTIIRQAAGLDTLFHNPLMKIIRKSAGLDGSDHRLAVYAATKQLMENSGARAASQRDVLVSKVAVKPPAATGFSPKKPGTHAAARSSLNRPGATQTQRARRESVPAADPQVRVSVNVKLLHDPPANQNAGKKLEQIVQRLKDTGAKILKASEDGKPYAYQEAGYFIKLVIDVEIPYSKAFRLADIISEIESEGWKHVNPFGDDHVGGHDSFGIMEWRTKLVDMAPTDSKPAATEEISAELAVPDATTIAELAQRIKESGGTLLETKYINHHHLTAYNKANLERSSSDLRELSYLSIRLAAPKTDISKFLQIADYVSQNHLLSWKQSGSNTPDASEGLMSFIVNLGAHRSGGFESRFADTMKKVISTLLAIRVDISEYTYKVLKDREIAFSEYWPGRLKFSIFASTEHTTEISKALTERGILLQQASWVSSDEKEPPPPVLDTAGTIKSMLDDLENSPEPKLRYTIPQVFNVTITPTIHSETVTVSRDPQNLYEDLRQGWTGKRPESSVDVDELDGYTISINGIVVGFSKDKQFVGIAGTVRDEVTRTKPVEVKLEYSVFGSAGSRGRPNLESITIVDSPK